jgi:hypothetical protein
VPVLLLASYRDDEVDRQHPLRRVLGELAHTPTHVRLNLVPLSPEAVATLAHQRDVDPDDLYRKTAGNPFFVVEALAADADEIPDTIRNGGHERAPGSGGDRAERDGALAFGDRGRDQSSTGRPEMAKVSKASAPHVEEMGVMEGRYGQLGEYTVGFDQEHAEAAAGSTMAIHQLLIRRNRGAVRYRFRGCR